MPVSSRGTEYKNLDPGRSVTFDVSQLIDLAQDLAGAGKRLAREVPKVIKKGANNIKMDARKRYREQAGAHGKGHAWRYPSTISYDFTTAARKVEAEIGPDKEKPQGALGNLLEFGSANSAPLPHLVPAWEKEIPKTEQALGDVLARVTVSKK